ncbi:MAG: Smr/MutS family protein [Acidobacteria bacterium]|nr:Smr/MutS family protein [Acidobacteriota bacterium]
MTPPKSGPEDDDAFLRAMGAVKRISHDPRGRVHATSPMASDQSTSARPTPPPPPKRAAAPIPEPDLGLDDTNSYVAAGVDRRELKKLRRGDHPPTDRVDLHGLKSSSAVDAVLRFINTRRTLHRVVAIVHGRGLRSTDNVAVLRPRVRAVLREHAAVIAYCDAPANDGGPGATYVLLKRS